MTTQVTGFIVGALASSTIYVAVPQLSFPRFIAAGVLLSAAIITAAWYLR